QRATETRRRTLATAEETVSIAEAFLKGPGPFRLGDHLSERVSALAAEMRAHGARVGLGEVLAPQGALAAVDCTSRTESYFALRASLCSTRAEMLAFTGAFTAIF